MIGRAAWYIYETYGQITRLISADGGGWDPIKPEIEAGIIEPFNLLVCDEPLGTLKWIYDGYWPTVRGNKREYIKVDWETANVGCMAVEGLTSIAQMLMSDMIEKGRKTSEEIVAKMVIENLTFGVGGRSHVGFVQQQINNMIIGFKSLPLKKIIYTALEHVGEDKSKKVILGPSIIGQAATATIGGKVGDMIHLVPTVNDKDKSIEVRGWFANHEDSVIKGPVWPAKCRNASNLSHEMRKAFGDKDYFVSKNYDYTVGLDTFMKAQDAIMAMGGESARLRRAEIDSRRNGGSDGKS